MSCLFSSQLKNTSSQLKNTSLAYLSVTDCCAPFLFKVGYSLCLHLKLSLLFQYLPEVSRRPQFRNQAHVASPQWRFVNLILTDICCVTNCLMIIIIIIIIPMLHSENLLRKECANHVSDVPNAMFLGFPTSG